MDLEENSQILMTSQFDNDIDLICSHWSKCQEEVRNVTISLKHTYLKGAGPYLGGLAVGVAAPLAKETRVSF